QTLGLLLGTGLAVVAGGVTAGSLACAGLVLALVIPYLLRSRDLRLVGDVGRFRAAGVLRAVLGFAAAVPGLLLGVADRQAGQPGQRARDAVPALLPAGRRRDRRSRDRRAGARRRLHGVGGEHRGALRDLVRPGRTPQAVRVALRGAVRRGRRCAGGVADVAG